jgi:hypothetical protein
MLGNSLPRGSPIAVPVLMTMVLVLVLKDVLPEGNKRLITLVGIIIFLVLIMTMVYVVAQTLSLT